MKYTFQDVAHSFLDTIAMLRVHSFFFLVLYARCSKRMQSHWRYLKIDARRAYYCWTTCGPPHVSRDVFCGWVLSNFCGFFGLQMLVWLGIFWCCLQLRFQENKCVPDEYAGEAAESPRFATTWFLKPGGLHTLVRLLVPCSATTITVTTEGDEGEKSKVSFHFWSGLNGKGICACKAIRSEYIKPNFYSPPNFAWFLVSKKVGTRTHIKLSLHFVLTS